MNLDPALVASKQLAFARRKALFRDDYGRLLDLLMTGRSVVTCAEAHRLERAPEPVVMIRHDVDHDIYTAVQMARWEADHGVRSTYCILHTAWYYGAFDGHKYARSAEVLETVDEIVALGHEINFHNNLVTLGLQTGVDPAVVLEDELKFWRSNGIVVDGTSSHGDALCRELRFRNFELFSENVKASAGGPRTISMNGHAVDLGVRSLLDFGLSYEAQDLPKDLYVSDSGSRLRIHRSTRGRQGKPRKAFTLPYQELAGWLTHPIWWDFSRDRPEGTVHVELDMVLSELAGGVLDV